MINNPSLNNRPTKIERALISVFDKTDAIQLAQQLINNRVEILSTGGTAKTLRSAGLKVVDVSDYTHYQKKMDGQVKKITQLIEVE